MKSVSIIIPCYNTGEIIEETFASLESQTSSDFEVVLVNDGSKDDTLKRLNAFKERTSLDVTVIDKPNGGVSTARNCGLRNANGKYILFLDSDDTYHKDYVRLVLESVQLQETDTVYCRLLRDLDEVSVFPTDKAVIVREDSTTAMNKLLYEMGKYGFYCYLYRADVLREHELWFDENTKYGEDREFIWKYLAHCKTFTWIDAPLYGYRDTPGSALKRTPYERVRGLEAVKRSYAYLKEQGCALAEEYYKYMYPRSSWALMKNFAINRSKDNFKRASKELDIRQSMKAMVKAPDGYVRALSKLYLIHPMVFYHMISLIGRVKK